ncbi:MAG: class IV adenylate cyclase [Candidatus Magasanikbacteria bacterium CG_4_10_14_0_2_um_filter_33_14]|uniref:Class IV adenylate cyclase n=1 Tax=Candidatus Magasanikbacteria bacterium CG_4_10_14_0_2_um_filter_33_14 TaxID=1974636 RepID=A0A2M7V9Z1_9BACT|nr:MAG: class IV adenylate cyclase [Candidatus Magasanikbacteria bacterium CG_4_10_14_0_2_um_filter_33_14]
MQKVELKFLDINVEEMKNKIAILGAKKIYDEDIISLPFSGEGFSFGDSNKKLLRIRKVNGDIVITYKGENRESQMINKEEIEIKVDDFDKASLLLERLGFEKGNLFTKHREHYEMGDIHFEFDTVFDIPTYLEIETQREQDMFDICTKLDLDINTGKNKTIVELFPKYFK